MEKPLVSNPPEPPAAAPRRVATAEAEPMTPVDFAWLRMDEPSNLMQINGVLVFDQPVSLGDLEAVMERRLVPIRRFRQRAVTPVSGPPRWQDDPGFDLRHHVVAERLPEPGDEPALQRAVGRLMSEPLDRARPLWRFHLFEGYRGGSVVLGRIHHSIGDGIALMMVLLSLADLAPEERVAPANPFLTLLRDPASGSRAACEQLEELMPEGLRLMVQPMKALRQAGRWLTGAAVAESLGRLTVRLPDPKTAFKGPLGVPKRVAWSGPVPLAEIKSLQAALGGTLNDVLMTAAAGGLRRYLEGREGAVAQRLAFRAAVPVNLRPLEEMAELGNRFGLVFPALPVGIADPRRRLDELRRRMNALKRSAEPLVTYGLLRGLGRAPLAVQRGLVKLLGTKATAVVTNVPGPRRTLYLAGRPIRDFFFWVPQAGRVGLGLSILSYDGRVRLGVGTDAGLVPDPETIARAFHDELDELGRLAG